MEGVTLQRAVSSDALLLAQMNRRLIDDEGSRNPMSLGELEERMTGWLKEAYTAMLIQLHDEVVGYLLYRSGKDEYTPATSEFHIRQFYVKHEHRGRGIGRAAMNHFIQDQMLPGSTIVIEVLESNPKGRRFWEGLGFRPYCTTLRRGADPLQSMGVMTSTSFDVRPMTIDDYDEVSSLWRNTEGVGLDERTDTREGIGSYLARNPELSYVARQERRIVGAVLCGHDGRRGYLHHLAVVSEWRQKGIGRALVEACLVQLSSIGIPKCNIFLFADNEQGKAFWKHNGWNERIDLKVLQRQTPEDRE